MPNEDLEKRILGHITSSRYVPATADGLVRSLAIPKAQAAAFHDALATLQETGRVELSGSGAVSLPAIPGRIVGTYRANARGFGFVIPDQRNANGDLYIPPGASADAVTGDSVSAKVVKKGRRAGRMVFEGRITEVLKRGINRFVGVLRRRLGRWFIVPEGNILHVSIYVGDPGAKGARADDQVVVELTQYPAEGVEARGVILKVLGPHGEPGVDTLSIIEQYQLPVDFSDAALEDARRASEEHDFAAELAHREDLRKHVIVTIDPVDARDFDDAISLSAGDHGEVELGVHIADVAHFVREGGALDGDARERATSVYLPRFVIPMLPERLSNGLCSLQEREPRLTKSVFITYDKSGRVVRTRFSNSVMQSTKRLTYEDATRAMEGTPGRMSAKVVSLLQSMEKLARVIHARRRRAGMLELDLPETDLVHDEEGRVIDVVPTDTSYSHKVIEMFMVEANEAVSRLLTQLGVGFLRRIHAEPDSLADGTLQAFLRAVGHPIPDDADRFTLQKLLDEVRGKAEGAVVHFAVLRSLKQAEYSPAHIGHFALASEDYCHFTSPIRRYPDLTIHRLLDRHLRNPDAARDRARSVPSTAELVRLGAHCSANERRAESAERELTAVLILRLLENHVGEAHSGVVTSLTNTGIFVQIDRFLIDGLLPFDGLPNDWWELNDTRSAVHGRRSGARIQVGGRIKVIISRIDIPARRLYFALAEALPKVKHGGERSKLHNSNTKRVGAPRKGISRHGVGRVPLKSRGAKQRGRRPKRN